MEKLRTIYRLRLLRGGLLLSVISVLWGLGLLVALKMFPAIISSQMKSKICIANNITTEAQMDVVDCNLIQAKSFFMDASLQAILLGVMSIVMLLLIIRLNGNSKIRIVISWLLGAGVVLYSAGIFLSALYFVDNGAVSIEGTNYGWIIGPGGILLFAGLLMSVIKIIKDLSGSATVH
ncbi:MAG: hypothetical protein R6V32_08030 [Bacteroidales bacterium]